MAVTQHSAEKLASMPRDAERRVSREPRPVARDDDGSRWERVGVGERLQACDSHGTWYDAKVVDVRGLGSSRDVKVHFHGWSKRHDEWLGATSGRLRDADETEGDSCVGAAAATASVRRFHLPSRAGRARRLMCPSTGQDGERCASPSGRSEACCLACLAVAARLPKPVPAGRLAQERQGGGADHAGGRDADERKRMMRII